MEARRLHARFILTALIATTLLFGCSDGPPEDNHAAQDRSGQTDPALVGAIDIHAHLDPDGYGPGENGRSLDVLELAEIAQAAGMRGFVIKQHYDQSADSAYLVREVYPDLEVFGGIGTNFATGGLNPTAIRQMALVKGGLGRIVWMPTWDAEHYVRNHGNDRPFISVAREGELLPEVKAVIATIAEVSGKTRGTNGRIVLATGHNAPEEGLLMAAEARRHGLEVVITHPLLASVDMNMKQMKEAVALGAYLEIVSHYAAYADGEERLLETIREIGPAHIIVSSDHGQGVGPEGDEGESATHLEGLSNVARLLRSNGFTEQELDMMFKHNPARLLGLKLL